MYFFYVPEEINLALNKLAWQISTSHCGVASQAVDGDSNPNRGSRSCTHTKTGHITPWLLVDLEQRYLIQKVKIKTEVVMVCIFISYVMN